MLRTQLTSLAAEQAQRAAEREAREAAEFAAALRARGEAEELARRSRPVQLFIHSASLPAEANPVGPINLTGLSTVAEVENKVAKWMETNLQEVSGVELPVPRARLRFAWNGRVLASGPGQEHEHTAVYDLGIQDLATLAMTIEPPTPKPESGKKKKKKGKKGKKKKAKAVNSDGEEVSGAEEDEDATEQEDGEDDENGEDDEDGEDGEDEEGEDDEADGTQDEQETDDAAKSAAEDTQDGDDV